MLVKWFEELLHGRPIALFLLAQGIFICGVLWYFFFRTRTGLNSDASFRLRESDRVPVSRRFRTTQVDRASRESRESREKSESIRLLPGIRIDGAPHEILGIGPEAPVEEIKKAHRSLMKRFHPDVVGRPGSREWKDAQRIAEAINRAKDTLLASRGPA